LTNFKAFGLTTGILAAVAGFNIPTSSQAAELNNGRPVVACTSTSIEGLFHQLIPILGLRELGYKIDLPRTLLVPIFHQSVALGDCDYAFDEWVPMMDAMFTPIENETKRLGPTITGATQGYLIDKATADAHHITSLEQFKDPAIAALFDASGDGKASLAGATPGWGSEKIINSELAAIGLGDTVKHNQGEYTALIADVVARLESGKPVLFYTWTPFWVTAKLKPGETTTWLNVDPKYCPKDQPCGESITGFPTNDIAILANKEFLAQNPIAERFLASVRIPIEDINAENLLVQNGENSEAAVTRHAEKWIAEHRSEFDKWLQVAKAAN
jgi:glycine betaine/proline transport system substrate-binding protein